MLVSALILCTACHRTTKIPETIESDFIQYKVHYLEEKAGDIPTRILPNTMDAYYTHYYVLTRIEGFFGQFSLIQIANLRNKRVTTLLNFFGNKVYYTGDGHELPAGIKPLEIKNLEYTHDTMRLADLLSYRIEVKTDESLYDIFYTKDIRIKHPNITTPYEAVNHPLSAFRIQLSYLHMDLVTHTHEKRMIESSAFTVPEEYKPVSRKAMEEIINSLFTKE